ncbi:MAG: glycine--tRNA ligase [Deltaproteobacteria bacterium RIFCSPLOWO2_12_FULL_44_12]|nr:MAG: glycine--tRNA ligase [Deltaproteobacteria bacterium RIFCSPHIGHO2_01_FULL_43_49]OGQ14507.1 MAG: glycine--tRNA ligase [Deltaproteobacteria bacterium RIFCSPHIGHO2_02_FULL_44_53]OGQ27893.1 MAG: glycine--tRNA ligase [Deltaproteobacteria bacterium RIFCSPHIGHO2_12_FULL_44_21]OGQ31105.1 MAG: glycine--tRNA ligase [Deltaproteobacteria bacterium RIFCSPLOWO2_01_FULL_45_74]OGQ43096.1 MAG: glycine--tRNA ligase [Deltaproteobacteria bacterium RIFCSPLOWO2_02_FULL_44_34]OGQ69750.1 MAG: glycine--tRNA lig
MVDMDTLTSLCKRRGFVFQSSEIYGGINGFWDFGPVGVELKRRVKDSWWKRIVQWREDVVGLDTSIIAHPQTWVASGHVSHFSDPMIDCKKCKRRFRADEINPSTSSGHGEKKCPECGGELTEARQFNLMFQTYVGANQDAASLAYLRPETCQSIFTEFKNVQSVARLKIPFGIAQIGKAFRNEITPRNFIFRSREFEQMELEFFCHPKESQKWYEYWVQERFDWFLSIGVKKENLRLRPHAKDELAHYAKGCTDIEFQMPFGWSELEGIADRSDYDLSQHIKTSGKDLDYFDEETKAKFVPAVVETSVGVDRTCLSLLIDAYREEEVKGEKRIVLGFHPTIAPFQIAVFPLSGKLREPAIKLEKDLRKYFAADYDEAGSIGKRYRRHDEVGTPFCITYDFQSDQDHAVTVRNRDTMQQDRIAIDQLVRYLNDKFSS